MVSVCGFGGLLEFSTGLLEEFLGFRGVSCQIKLIGRLGRLNFLKAMSQWRCAAARLGCFFALMSSAGGFIPCP